MGKYTTNELIEVWEIYMGLCEEFPELYDQYVEKVEKDLEINGLEIKVTEEEKEFAMNEIWKRIKSES